MSVISSSGVEVMSEPVGNTAVKVEEMPNLIAVIEAFFFTFIKVLGLNENANWREYIPGCFPFPQMKAGTHCPYREAQFIYPFQRYNPKVYDKLHIVLSLGYQSFDVTGGVSSRGWSSFPHVDITLFENCLKARIGESADVLFRVSLDAVIEGKEFKGYTIAIGTGECRVARNQQLAMTTGQRLLHPANWVTIPEAMLILSTLSTCLNSIGLEGLNFISSIICHPKAKLTSPFSYDGTSDGGGGRI